MVTYKPTTNPSPLYRLRRRIRANESRHRVEDEVTVGLVAEPHRITVLGHRPRKTLETPQRCGVQVHLLLAKKKIVSTPMHICTDRVSAEDKEELGLVLLYRSRNTCPGCLTSMRF